MSWVRKRKVSISRFYYPPKAYVVVEKQLIIIIFVGFCLLHIFKCTSD